MPPVRQNGHDRSEAAPSPEDTTQAQTEPQSEKTKSYCLRVIKGSSYRAPFEELYERNYSTPEVSSAMHNFSRAAEMRYLSSVDQTTLQTSTITQGPPPPTVEAA